MPKFLYTIILFILIFIGIDIHTLLTKRPDSIQNIMLFLISTTIWIFLSISVILFFRNKKKRTEFYNPRLTYRKGLKMSLWVTTGIMGILTLKVFNLLNFITGGLFFIFLLAIHLTNTLNTR